MIPTALLWVNGLLAVTFHGFSSMLHFFLNLFNIKTLTYAYAFVNYTQEIFISAYLLISQNVFSPPKNVKAIVEYKSNHKISVHTDLYDLGLIIRKSSNKSQSKSISQKSNWWD